MAHKLIDWAAEKHGSVKQSEGKPGQADWNKIRVFGLHSKPREAGWNRYAAKTFDAERMSRFGFGKPIVYRSLSLTMTGNAPFRAADGSDVFWLTCVALDSLCSMFREIQRGKFRNAAGARNRATRATHEGYRFFAEARSYRDFDHLMISANESRRIIQERHELARASRKDARKGKKKERRKVKAKKREEHKDPLIRAGENARKKTAQALAALKSVA